MHVRIAWEIYHHQQKQQAEAKAAAGGVPGKTTELLRPPGHLFQTGPSAAAALSIGGPPLAPPFSATMQTHAPGPPPPPVSHAVGFLTAPSTHMSTFRKCHSDFR